MPSSAGWKSTEFWVTVVIQIVGLLGLAGVFTPEQSEKWVKVVEAAGGVLAMAFSSVGYSMSRAKVKAQESKSASAVVVSRYIADSKTCEDEKPVEEIKK